MARTMLYVPMAHRMLWPLLTTGAAFAVATLVALAARRMAIAALERWTREKSWLRFYGDLIARPSPLWCLVVGLYAASETADEFALLGGRWYGALRLLLDGAVILAVTLTLTRLAGRLIARASQRQALGVAVTGLAESTGRATILVIGFLVLLAKAGVQITPILTALGVGGLAVALALQETLANLFAGIHLLVDHPVRIGDYVKMGDGVEGTVTDVGWRSTRLRTLGNNVLVLPNQTVARATITNYDLPDSRYATGLRVSVDLGAEPDHVEAILLDEALHASREVPGMLAAPAPSVSLIPGFGEYSLDFTVGYSVATFVDQYRVQHELRKRVLHRLRREGVDLPTPARTLHLTQ